MIDLVPTVSIIIPTFNESKNIKRCLESIFSQEYPKNKLEVIIVDDYSTDDTLIIAEKYPVKILKSGKRHGEISKMMGFKNSTGKYVMYLDADIELRGADWIRKMIKPLSQHNDIIGSFTRYYSKSTDFAIERYITMDPLQRDSIYQYFSPSIEETIIDKKQGYSICQYSINKIPPAGLCLYEKEKLMPLIDTYDMFLELDFLVLLVKSGYCKFAYVPTAGLFHHHVSSFFELLRKRKYNLTKVYLLREKRLYKWFDLQSPRDIWKITLWIIYANLVIPSLFVGIYKSIKYSDVAGLFEPIVNLLVTDLILFTFLYDKRGRTLLSSRNN